MCAKQMLIYARLETGKMSNNRANWEKSFKKAKVRFGL